MILYIVLNYFDILISIKKNLIKNYYFDVFMNKKHFELRLLPLSQFQTGPKWNKSRLITSMICLFSFFFYYIFIDLN